MKYEVITYGAGILRQKAIPVKEVNRGIRRLVEGMIEAMQAQKGVGLAAQQVGETVAVCVVDVSGRTDEAAAAESVFVDGLEEMPLALVNPEIVEKEGTLTQDEGCLSFPGIHVPVRRAARITVSFLGLDGRGRSLRACNLLARAIQHEVDHLNGVLLVDRMSAVKKVSLAGQLKRLKQETEKKLQKKQA